MDGTEHLGCKNVKWPPVVFACGTFRVMSFKIKYDRNYLSVNWFATQHCHPWMWHFFSLMYIFIFELRVLLPGGYWLTNQFCSTTKQLGIHVDFTFVFIVNSWDGWHDHKSYVSRIWTGPRRLDSSIIQSGRQGWGRGRKKVSEKQTKRKLLLMYNQTLQTQTLHHSLDLRQTILKVEIFKSPQQS